MNQGKNFFDTGFKNLSKELPREDARLPPTYGRDFYSLIFAD